MIPRTKQLVMATDHEGRCCWRHGDQGGPRVATGVERSIRSRRRRDSYKGVELQ